MLAPKVGRACRMYSPGASPGTENVPSGLIGLRHRREPYTARPAAVHRDDEAAGGSRPGRIDDDAADRCQTRRDEREVGDHFRPGDDLDWLGLRFDRGAGVERGGESRDGRFRENRAMCIMSSGRADR